MMKVQLFSLPTKAFLKEGRPFSFILYDGLKYAPEKYENGKFIDEFNLNTPTWKLMRWIFTNYREFYNNHIHVSQYSCGSEDFDNNKVLTINAITGEWMLRKPYSKVYP